MAELSVRTPSSQYVAGRAAGTRRRIGDGRHSSPSLLPKAKRCRAKFLRQFPKGFRDETYLQWERGYKWRAHKEWEDCLHKEAFRKLLKDGQFETIAARAVTIESRTNLLFSFEKMALRDAVKSKAGARAFAAGLFEFLHGRGQIEGRFDAWCDVVGALPRRQTRVLTWPVTTIFGFIAQPSRHFYLKPIVTRRAFEAYGLPFIYNSKPNGKTYRDVIAAAGKVKRDLVALQPRDMIDIQSFLWVQGSDEY